MKTGNHELDGLGEALESATTAQLTDAKDRNPRRARRPAIVAFVAAALLVPAAAFASGLLTSHDVEVGMPAGSAIFEGTDPTCTVVTDGVEYRCVLASSPTVEVQDSYRGTKELTVDLKDSTINGGCIGTTADGREWECYIGMAAVEHQILTADLLGQLSEGPGRG